jgi:hypothetical protein
MDGLPGFGNNPENLGSTDYRRRIRRPRALDGKEQTTYAASKPFLKTYLVTRYRKLGDPLET